MAKKKAAKKATSQEASARRRYVSQADIPKHSLREVLTIPQAITDSFAGDPTSPHQVAMALEISPTSSAWRYLSGAAVAYGLTKGGNQADKIALTQLGVRCTAPAEEGDDIAARGEAALTPKVPKKFFQKYNRKKFPSDKIAKNVLEQEFDVPLERLDETLKLLKDDASFVGFIHQTKTGAFVSIDDLSPAPVTVDADAPDSSEDDALADQQHDEPEVPKLDSPPPGASPSGAGTSFRVFISHGRNKKIVAQVKDVLELYDIDYEIAVEEESAAIPVPHKVLAAMRKCQARIMIVSPDNEEAAEAGTINNNVLIEIGSAFVLYDQQVVLLWDKRLKVPSNLQGLYRCDFEGSELSFASGTKLAKSVKGFRK